MEGGVTPYRALHPGSCTVAGLQDDKHYSRAHSFPRKTLGLASEGLTTTLTALLEGLHVGENVGNVLGTQA